MIAVYFQIYYSVENYNNHKLMSVRVQMNNKELF